MDPEKQPLLNHRRHGDKSKDPRESYSSPALVDPKPKKSFELSKSITIEDVKLKRHITLLHAIGIIVGNVIGSGIFVSSKGVTENTGSVGGSLCVWAFVGVYVLIQALCYTELAGIMPVTGGDYSYAYNVLGPLPGFLVAWIHVAIIAPSAAGAIAQTAGLYLAKAAGHEDNQSLINVIAVMAILLFLFINGLSVRVAANLNTLLSAAKTLALCFIILTGVVWLANGNTENLEDPFKGTSTNPGTWALAMLDGYYAYKGWELVTALPEEMINPRRNLPIALITSVLTISSIYVLTNVAYFAALTPAEVIESDAVALTFADKILGPGLASIVAVAVAMSSMGTVNAGYLTDTRYVFAAGRNQQVPQVMSMINYKLFTPLPALLLIAVVYLLYSSIPLLDQLLEYASLGVQVKIAVALIALLVIKRRRPDIERPISVHWSLVVLCLVVIVAMVSLSLYKNPITAGIGLALCFMGVPVYGLVVCLPSLNCSHSFNEILTKVLQKLLLVVSTSRDDQETST